MEWLSVTFITLPIGPVSEQTIHRNGYGSFAKCSNYIIMTSKLYGFALCKPKNEKRSLWCITIRCEVGQITTNIASQHRINR